MERSVILNRVGQTVEVDGTRKKLIKAAKYRNPRDLEFLRECRLDIIGMRKIAPNLLDKRIDILADRITGAIKESVPKIKFERVRRETNLTGDELTDKIRHAEKILEEWGW